jgi:acetaldehyde dehydrogenase (acetylating)
MPIRGKLIEALKREGGYFMNDEEKDRLRGVLLHKGRLNVEQVGKSPAAIARMAGFSVPDGTRALIGEVDAVGKGEPLSMETLSPILAFYTADGWQAGCDRCIEVLHFGGIGHTLGLHCTSERVIEAFALQKPAMRIVVNTVAALGSVGFTNRLFPAMTLGPGTVGGSITSDNISPLHLLNVKRLAFETDPINPPSDKGLSGKGLSGDGRSGDGRSGTGMAPARAAGAATRPVPTGRSWIDDIESRLLARAGNPQSSPLPASPPAARPPAPVSPAPVAPASPSASPPAASARPRAAQPRDRRRPELGK